MIRTYESVAALRNFALSCGILERPSGTFEKWYGESERDTLRKSEIGDTSLCHRLKRLWIASNRK